MRTLPAQYMFRPFCQHPLEAHPGSQQTDFITVDQRGVAQYLRSLAEVFLDFLCLTFYFRLETLLFGKRSKTVGIGFGKELHTAGTVQFLQFLQHLGSVYLQLLDTHARERERHFESLSALMDHLQQGLQSRHIALVGNL